MNIIPIAKSLFFSDPKAPISTPRLLILLEDTLPAFAAVALRFYDDVDSLFNKVGEDETSGIRQFYHDFNIKSVMLVSTIQYFDMDPSSPNTELYFSLLRVADMLESSFCEWEGEVASICTDIGLEKNLNDTYPKLSALRRILPAGGLPQNEGQMEAMCRILHLHSNGLRAYGKKLAALDSAFFIIQKMQQNVYFKADCPMRLRDYPVQNLYQSSGRLFTVLEKQWKCKCNTPHHTSRSMKLNLTQHQRFEMKSLQGDKGATDQPQFRVLFPTSLRPLHWQHADITIKESNLDDDTDSKILDNLCQVIDEGEATVLPKMSIFKERLWQNRHVLGRNVSLRTPHGEFETLGDLLKPSPYTGISLMSTIDMKDRIVLSFTLGTSFFHIVNMKESRLQAHVTSSNICFQAWTKDPKINRPYLDVSFLEQNMRPKPSTERLNKVHWIPSILDLGILLLEICRGSALDITSDDNECAMAISVFERLQALRGSSGTGEIPDACFAAISACIDPNELRKSNMHLRNVDGAQIRAYIFRQVLYPLGDALSTLYGLPLHKIHDDIPLGSDDKESKLGPIETATRRAGKLWQDNLEVLHDIFYHRRFKRCLQLNPKSATVKIAVLDTGFQLQDALQKNYIEEGRIARSECKTFCSSKYDSKGWDTDTDGHGTYVGQIILNVAPTAKLYVAKVLQSRKDLVSQKWAATVQQNIANAIIHAAEIWRVDMIIMSFGFEAKVRTIKKAIRDVRKLQKTPLLFAATHNDGANKSVAWPASDADVFGVSSTDGLGVPSSFNPADGGSDTILYAFGEGVKVEPPAGNRKLKAQTHVSGTSFAAPTAAALVANLLGFVRLSVLLCSEEDREMYSHVPSDLMEMGDLLKVLKKWMMKEDQTGQKSLLPWDFLNTGGIDRNTTLHLIYKTLET